MRIRNHEIHDRINGNLKVEFAEQQITSYSGLELFKRYFRLIDLNSRIKRAFRAHEFSGDYSVIDYILIFITLWITGGRRLRHVAFLADDPLVKRLCGLKTLPCDRSISRWLGQFTNDSLQALVSLNSEIVEGKLKELNLSRITLDFDGTVLSTGNQVAWAFRGYNPHKRFAKSYYPLLCHIAQTGHFLQVRNRPGNIHDSKGALAVIRDCITQVKKLLPKVVIEVRLDAAFFTREIVAYLDKARIEYVVKMPMWQWTGIKEAINATRYWYHANHELSWAKKSVFLKKWGREVEVICFRKKLSSKPGGTVGHQMDLFSPDDGIYEYFVLHTNKKARPDNIAEFYNGRCAMEHQIAEIKGEFGFNVVPTRHYQGNSAHQLISVLAYNLVRNFQIDSGIAKDRRKTAKRTNLFHFESLKTIRFEMVAAAGRILNIAGAKILRLNKNIARQNRYQTITKALIATAA
ncbi:MAG: IS1380 family transposase [Bacteroidota bacterium]